MPRMHIVYGQAQVEDGLAKELIVGDRKQQIWRHFPYPGNGFLGIDRVEAALGELARLDFRNKT